MAATAAMGIVILVERIMAKILLHSCCAPCSGAVIEKLLQDGYDFSVFFSNSNIVPFEEYELRKAELMRYCAAKGVEVIDDDYNHEDWLKAVQGLENEPERGSRCSICFLYRLRRAAQYANNHGFTLLTTTLASSRWKDLNQVNAAGIRAVEGTGVEFWEANWRKGGLQPRRNEIIKEQGFYNQTFCGCEFSKH